MFLLFFYSEKLVCLFFFEGRYKKFSIFTSFFFCYSLIFVCNINKLASNLSQNIYYKKKLDLIFFPLPCNPSQKSWNPLFHCLKKCYGNIKKKCKEPGLFFVAVVQYRLKKISCITNSSISYYKVKVLFRVKTNKIVQ